MWIWRGNLFDWEGYVSEKDRSFEMQVTTAILSVIAAVIVLMSVWAFSVLVGGR
jgi:saccharopine dehydrogenase-like NADP-dependent oxidoreductase